MKRGKTNAKRKPLAVSAAPRGGRKEMIIHCHGFDAMKPEQKEALMACCKAAVDHFFSSPQGADARRRTGNE
jgi:hypothetical protein